MDAFPPPEQQLHTPPLTPAGPRDGCCPQSRSDAPAFASQTPPLQLGESFAGCWRSFLTRTFTSRPRPVPKHIEQRKPFSAVINEKTFTPRTQSLKRSESAVSENNRSNSWVWVLCFFFGGGGNLYHELSRRSVVPKGSRLLWEGTQRAVLNPFLAAQTNQTKQNRRAQKLPVWRNFRQLPFGETEQERTRLQRCTIVKSDVAAAVTKETRTGHYSGLGEEDSCRQSHNPSLEKKDFA